MKRINSRSDITTGLNVPLLAQLSQSIPHRIVSDIKNQPLMSVESILGSPDSGVEDAGEDCSSNIVLVTSTHPAEGKSTFLIHYGAALAQSGYQVMLVDGDLYRPTLHERLDISTSPGISELVDRPLDRLTDAIAETAVPRLFTLPAGRSSISPSSVFDSIKISQILDQLSRQFDIVLVDAPPVFIVEAAAVVLASCVHKVILVVKKGQTMLSECADVLEQLQMAGADVLGIVFTNFKQQKNNHSLATLSQNEHTLTEASSLQPHSGMDLRHANLAEASLFKSELQEADLFHANLHRAFMFRSELEGANLYRANLQEANLAATNLQRANLGIADLQKAVLFGANLREANLALANLKGANLFGANLQSANLSFAYLQGADLSGADLEGANLERVKINNETYLPDGTKWTEETQLSHFTQI